ncbi:MAG TPA: tetratricopeptide repeat protein [Pirellulales bacterium]|nr:tetratricopeptide repeat protein [Pirellulales bacterium]
MLRFVRRLSCGSLVAWGWILAFGWTSFVCQLASAQIDVLNELYGSGVHAYNTGLYRDAYDDFTMAIKSGSKDPRVYYYRGLAYLRLGRPQEAQADFKKAASLEMADTDRFYPVSKSLERVQGSARAQIERYRSQARLVAYQTRERQRFDRYQRIRKNEPNVLMPEDATQMPSPAKEEGPPAPAEEAEEPESEMPAEKPEATEKEPDEEMPAEEPDVEAADPFAEKGDEEAADNMPADEMPADEAVEKEDDEEKAEGDESAEEKKADDDPFAE